MKSSVIYMLGLSVIMFSASVLAEKSYVPFEPFNRVNAPFKMNTPTRPLFPDRVFSIVDSGAKAEAGFDNGPSINWAIEKCNKAGGGTVLVPAGKYFSGPIRLLSNVNLHFDEGAVMTFLSDASKHLPPVLTRYEGTEVMNFKPFIYAHNCENIALTGHGVINGPGEHHWRKSMHLLGNIKNPGKMRWRMSARVAEELSRKDGPVESRDASKSFLLSPSLFHPVNCRNVLVEGIKIGECGPKWTLHFVYCTNLIVRRIYTDFDGPSTDAVVIDSCENVLVEHCDLKGGDDLVVIKSGTNEDGWRVNKPTRNVVVRHINGMHSGCAGFSIGSEMSGGVENVYFHDIDANVPKPFRIKSRPGRGSFVRNITVERIQSGKPGKPQTAWVKAEEVKPPSRPCIQIVELSNAYKPLRSTIDTEKVSIISNVVIRDIHAKLATNGLIVQAMGSNSMTDISFENIEIETVKDTGISINSPDEVALSNITIAGKPASMADNKREVEQDGAEQAPTAAE